MKKAIILASVIVIGAICAFLFNSGAQLYAEASVIPIWLENDSINAIKARMARDFNIPREQLIHMLREKFPDITDSEIDNAVNQHYLEKHEINGEDRFFRKSLRNYMLLNPSVGTPQLPRGTSASLERISYVDSVLSFYSGLNDYGLSHQIVFRFSIDVPGDSCLIGDTLRVWMPLPFGNEFCSRQSNVKILNSEPAEYTLSNGKSIHNTIYFQAPAPMPDDTAHFEYIGSFVTSGQYICRDSILRVIQPYDIDDDTYQPYTQFDNPHIVRLDSLAGSIVGNEKNPFLQSEMVFDYIINKYPWAGAREYSTIDCIPEYVISEGHGDCGQVALLYISLMRTLGVPARWESGWMLHPGEVNLHDWAEVYFNGIGWIPVDVSFGRYTGSENPEITGFYSHGMDSYRFATNKGIGGSLYPPKKFIRSETVDFQLGEVECGKGNIYYPAWNSNLEIISSKPIFTNR